jgi:hypothetical protein
MNKSTLIQKIILGIFCQLLVNTGISQTSGRSVLKKYCQSDSLSANSGGQLFLYEDGTFLNSGIFKDLAHQEVFVWYATGTWVIRGAELFCQSEKNPVSGSELIEEIKQNYKKRKDYRLIDSYYEFVREKYNQYTFKLSEEKAIDVEKNIEYTELKHKQITSTN